jgi:hypothetical protein
MRPATLAASLLLSITTGCTSSWAGRYAPVISASDEVRLDRSIELRLADATSGGATGELRSGAAALPLVLAPVKDVDDALYQDLTVTMPLRLPLQNLTASRSPDVAPPICGEITLEPGAYQAQLHRRGERLTLLLLAAPTNAELARAEATANQGGGRSSPALVLMRIGD